MIAHIAPAANLFEETYNTLVYAHRAKNIKNNPIRNTLVVDTHLSNYVNVINNLKK
jgi:kinesin family protein 18/19